MYVVKTVIPAGDENKARVYSSGKTSPPGGGENQRKKRDREPHWNHTQ